jgi:Na+/phosphate symporter
MLIAVQLLVALIGLLLYLLTTNAKLQEVGRLMFFAGIATFLMTYHATVGLLGR